MNPKNREGRNMRNTRVLLTLLFAFVLVRGAVPLSRLANAAPRPPAVTQEAKQDSGPSLEDTVAWIAQKLIGNYTGARFTRGDLPDPGPYGTTLRIKSATARGCKLSYVENIWNREDRQAGTEKDVTVSFDFSEYAGNSATSFALNDYEDCRDNPTFKRQSLPPTACTLYMIMITPKGKNGSVTFVYTNDNELAPRIAKALNHAIELCGGKPEPF